MKERQKKGLGRGERKEERETEGTDAMKPVLRVAELVDVGAPLTSVEQKKHWVEIGSSLSPAKTVGWTLFPGSPV